MSLGSRLVHLQSLSPCCFLGLSLPFRCPLGDWCQSKGWGSCGKGAAPKSCLIPNCGSSEGPLDETPVQLFLTGALEAQMELSTHLFPPPLNESPCSWMYETTSRLYLQGGSAH